MAGINVINKPLPISESFFDSMIENGYYYVDKTLLIKDLLDRKARVVLCTRPRRFGKTLNQTMLKNFFEDTAPLGYWFKALTPKNLKNILERMRRGMRNEKAFQEVLESFGLSDRCLWEKGVREGMQKGRQEGMQKGRQEGIQKGRQEGAREVITLLEKGYSLADAKKKLRLPLTRTRRTRATTRGAD